MNTGKSNATDMTTDMFMNMLSNNDNVPKTNSNMPFPNNGPGVDLFRGNGGNGPRGLQRGASNDGFGMSFNNNPPGLNFGGMNTINNNMGEGSTPRNNTLLMPTSQPSGQRDFSVISPNNIIGQQRMDISQKITPLMNTRSLLGPNQGMGSFSLGTEPPRFGGM